MGCSGDESDGLWAIGAKAVARVSKIKGVVGSQSVSGDD